MFAIPYIFMMIVIVISGQLADHIRARQIMSTTAVRKLQTIIGNDYVFVLKQNDKILLNLLSEIRWSWFVCIFDTHRLCWM
jgi:hypothetical protein